MATWMINEPQRLQLDGDVARLEVKLVYGRLNVVGTDGPARVELSSVGRKGVIVSHEGGVLTVRHETPKWGGPWFLSPFRWLTVGRRRYDADMSIAVPVGAGANISVIAGNVVASGLRQGA